MEPFFTLVCSDTPTAADTEFPAMSADDEGTSVGDAAPAAAGSAMSGDGSAIEAEVADVIRPHNERSYRYLSKGPRRRVYSYR